MISFLTIFLGGGLVLFLGYVLITMSCNWFEYKYYKQVYESLPFRKFCRNSAQVYSYQGDKLDNQFVWFLVDNHFRLRGNTYLFNNSLTKHDPYAYYWLRKYRKWFAENVEGQKVRKVLRYLLISAKKLGE